jgi:exodeoxyribonuclease VII small subunit
MGWLMDAALVDVSDLPFETAFSRLEATVALLESGTLTIDEMIEKFEEGIALVTQCRRRLDAAQTRVTILTREVEDYVIPSEELDVDFSG